MNWYVAQVMTGKEESITNRIRELGIKAIVPIRVMREMKNGTWRNIERVLFPSYVFVHTGMDVETYYKLKPIPGIIRFLGEESGAVPIQEEEVNLLLHLTKDGDPLGLSEVFVADSKVTVVSGPLQGLEGKIIKIDARRFRAKVDISFMGEPRIVELAVNVIKKSEA